MRRWRCHLQRCSRQLLRQRLHLFSDTLFSDTLCGCGVRVTGRRKQGVRASRAHAATETERTAVSQALGCAAGDAGPRAIKSCSRGT